MTEMDSQTERLPVVYLPHGGGPWPFVDVGFGEPESLRRLATYLRGIAALPKSTPRGIIVVSAHWEEAVPTVMTSRAPPLYFDYSGFPKAAYTLTWPAEGSPALAARVRALLAARGIPSGENSTRGFDHGAFVPLKVAYPDPAIPTLQLSLKRGLDPAEHLEMGAALAPLRDEGIFIVGSGMSYHNMRGFGRPQSMADSAAFDAWLQETVQSERALRNRRLTEWTRAPHARDAHPREEHLMPLMVVAGAAGDDRGSVPYGDTLMAVRVSSAHFG